MQTAENTLDGFPICAGQKVYFPLNTLEKIEIRSGSPFQVFFNGGLTASSWIHKESQASIYTANTDEIRTLQYFGTEPARVIIPEDVHFIITTDITMQYFQNISRIKLALIIWAILASCVVVAQFIVLAISTFG